MRIVLTALLLSCLLYACGGESKTYTVEEIASSPEYGAMIEESTALMPRILDAVNNGSGSMNFMEKMTALSKLAPSDGSTDIDIEAAKKIINDEELIEELADLERRGQKMNEKFGIDKLTDAEKAKLAQIYFEKNPSVMENMTKVMMEKMGDVLNEGQPAPSPQ